MRVRFTKFSNDHHRLDVVRSDGSKESADLETKSLLQHDFIHFALESEAKLTQSFWGKVNGGKSFLELAGKMESAEKPAEGSEILLTEMLVGALTGADKEQTASTEFVERFFSWCTEIGVTAPPWLTPELIDRTREHLRRIRGKWNATPFGETMEILWSE